MGALALQKQLLCGGLRLQHEEMKEKEWLQHLETKEMEKRVVNVLIHAVETQSAWGRAEDQYNHNRVAQDVGRGKQRACQSI